MSDAPSRRRAVRVRRSRSMPTARSTYPGSAVRLARPVMLIATALIAAGCAAHPIAPIPANVAPFGRNVTLIYLPGIGGYGNYDRGWVNGLKVGGYSGKTEV